MKYCSLQILILNYLLSQTILFLGNGKKFTNFIKIRWNIFFYLYSDNLMSKFTNENVQNFEKKSLNSLNMCDLFKQGSLNQMNNVDINSLLFRNFDNRNLNLNRGFPNNNFAFNMVKIFL